MTIHPAINLTNFVPALDKLAEKIDSAHSSEREIANAAMTLSTGIISIASMQDSESDPSCPWEGALDDHSLAIYSASHQLIFSLDNGALKSAVLSGPQLLTWNLNRSERGLHVMVVSVDGTVHKDSLITKDGSLKDLRNVAENMQELHAEWQKIADQPEESLSPYTPAGDLIDVGISGVDTLEDVTTDGSNGYSSAGSEPADYQSSNNNSNWLGEPPAFDSGGGSNAPIEVIELPGSLIKVSAAGIAGAAIAALSGAASKAAVKPDAAQVNTGQFAALKPLVLANVIGEKFTLTQYPAIVGRISDCQLVLPGNLVSRQHARFFVDNNELMLEDLQSSNGTKVNEVPLKGTIAILQGDTIKFADIELVVLVGPEPQPIAPENLKTMTFNMAEKLKQQSSNREVSQPPAPPPMAPLAPPPRQSPVSPAPMAPPPLAPPPRQSPVSPAPMAPPPLAPPPSSSDEDLLAKAARAAKNKMAAAPPTAPVKDDFKPINQSGQWADEEALTAAKLLQAPALRGIATAFALLMIGDHIRLLVRFGDSIADSERFTLGLGMGLGLTLLAWITGSSTGFFRFLTKVTALAFVGHQLYRDHMFLQSLIQSPLLLQQLDNLLPLGSLLLALWLFKRARNNGK